MKITRLIFSVLLVLAILQGCNTAKKDTNDLEDTTKEVKDETEDRMEDRDHDDDIAKKVDIKNEKLPFNFTKFDLNVDYKNDQSYDADFQNKTDFIEVEIEDEVNNKRIQGDEAYDELKPILEKLSFDQSTSDEDVIKQVIDGFNLKSDYEQFELEVRFDDGTEKEYRK